MILNIHKEKYQAETVKKTLKNLSEFQWYTVNVKSLNVHTFLLKIHFFNILNSEEEVKKELINVNAIYQQFNKVVLQWTTTQNSVS